MKTLIRNRRKEKKLLIREVANFLEVDAALVSRFESGERLPSETQVLLLARFLDLNQEQLITMWLKEKILTQFKTYPMIPQALKLVQEELQSYSPVKIVLSPAIEGKLQEADKLKHRLNAIRQNSNFRIIEALEMEYTFESNRIEGNTLSLMETDFVVNKGLTISGKSMQEHLEAINHKEAIHYVKQLVEQNSSLRKTDVLAIHNLILRGIRSDEAGKYRTMNVSISGTDVVLPEPFRLYELMENYFEWYNGNRTFLHPIVLAAEMHERLVTIHPFIDGNGRTARLIMNMILLQNGYAIANIKGDNETRMKYYSALQKVQTDGSKDEFVNFIADTAIDSLKRYLKLIGEK